MASTSAEEPEELHLAAALGYVASARACLLHMRVILGEQSLLEGNLHRALDNLEQVQNTLMDRLKYAVRRAEDGGF